MFTGHPHGHLDVVEVRTNLRIINQLEIGAGYSSEAKTRWRQQIAEQIALGLIETGQFSDVFRMLGHVIGQRILQRCHTTETDVLVDLAQLRREGRWCNDEAGVTNSDEVSHA